MAKRLVSGIQPTGTLHLGNYLGAIKQWVELQNNYEAFFFIADYHSLTERPEPETLEQQSLETAAMLIALGVDPKSSALFVQSQIPEHAELTWLLMNFVTLGQLNRMTQFKEKAERHGQNAGLLTYPVLMAADVLIYDASAVPVGEDQVQHLELAREIARSFNAHAGRVFKEPKALINKAARVMALNNPAKKMSKSVLGSAIGLLDTDDQIEQAIKRSVTDSDPNSPKLSPGVANLFTILEAVSSRETFLHFQRLHKDGSLRYAELKEQLIDDVISFLGPVQKTYGSLMKNEGQLRRILEQGRKIAQPIAQEKLAKAKQALGLLS